MNNTLFHLQSTYKTFILQITLCTSQFFHLKLIEALHTSVIHINSKIAWYKSFIYFLYFQSDDLHISQRIMFKISNFNFGFVCFPSYFCQFLNILFWGYVVLDCIPYDLNILQAYIMNFFNLLMLFLFLFCFVFFL